MHSFKNLVTPIFLGPRHWRKSLARGILVFPGFLHQHLFYARSKNRAEGHVIGERVKNLLKGFILKALK